MDDTRDEIRPEGETRVQPHDTIPAEAFDAMPGTLVDGRYLITGTLGEGGMGRVYRATHVLMDKPVALKVIHSELAHVEDVTRRFEREAKSSSRLTDPHCITVTDFGRTEDGVLFLVMELLDGESLDARLKREGPMKARDALVIAAQILQGLAHAHAQDVVHRDLKPENVFLTTHGEERDFVKILDFGIAKIMSASEEGEGLTRAGVVFGTPKYLSPEQAVGDRVDSRADLYAVGVILWEMLTGKPPFQAESTVDLLSMHLTAPPPLLSEHGRFPRGLQELIDRAMAKRADDRFATAEEFIAAIAEVDPDAAPRSRLFQMLYHVDRRAQALPGSHTIARFPLFLRLAITAVAISAVVVAGVFAFKTLSPRFQEPPATLEPVVIVPSQEVGDIGKETDAVVGLLDAAEKQIQAGSAAEAVITVKKALAVKPDLPPAILLLAHAEFLSGARDQAMTDYDKALVADRALAADIRLQENLREGLKWATTREKAAFLLAAYCGTAGLGFLKGLANSALTDGEVRRTARAALVETKNEAQIDWLTSLTADFNELEKCKDRKDVIDQMARTGNKGFLPLLEKYRSVKVRGRHGRVKKTNACVGESAAAAILALTGGAPDGGSAEP